MEIRTPCSYTVYSQGQSVRLTLHVCYQRIEISLLVSNMAVKNSHTSNFFCHTNVKTTSPSPSTQTNKQTKNSLLLWNLNVRYMYMYCSAEVLLISDMDKLQCTFYISIYETEIQDESRDSVVHLQVFKRMEHVRPF